MPTDNADTDHRWCGLENLEQRLLLSASIQVHLNDDVVIEGGDGADTVVIREHLESGNLEYSFDGFDFSQDLDATTTGIQAVAAAGANVKVDLGAGDDRLEIVGSAEQDVFEVTAANATLGSDNGLSVDHENVEALSLRGDDGADVFQIAMASANGPLVEIDGGDGADTLVAAEKANTWNLTDQNEGTLEAANGTGDAEPSVAFARVENLTGGDGNDRFVFTDRAGVTGIIDGGGGVNTLDYSDYTGDVTVALALGSGPGAATGTGGIANIQNVVFGHNANNRLIVAGLTDVQNAGPAGPADSLDLVEVEGLALAAADHAGSTYQIDIQSRLDQAPTDEAATEITLLPDGSLTVTPRTGSSETGAGEGVQFSLLYLARGPPADTDGTPYQVSSAAVTSDDPLVVVAINPEDSGTSLEQFAAEINVAMVALVLGKRSRDQRSKKESGDRSARTAEADHGGGWRDRLAKLINARRTTFVTPAKYTDGSAAD